MPTYEYACSNCGFHLEEFQSMKEDALIKCPNCGQNKLQKLIGAGTGVIFKGSGFYVTDYKKKNSTGSKPSSRKKEKTESPETKESKETKEIKEIKEKKESSESKSKDKGKDKKSDTKSK
ncbi:MAG: FmdB family zinc ribbon protein [Ignavibacteria bacterium]